MNIDKFLESKVIPDVVQRATLYAVRTLESVENEYTKPYDEAVHLFRKCGKTKKEAYEMTGLLGLKNSWGRWCSGMISMLCQRICPKENADYFQKDGYGDGILSYEQSGRVYRRGPDTDKKIAEWANEQGNDKAEFLKQRITIKLLEKFPKIKLGEESITNILDVSHGPDSTEWRFTISTPRLNKIIVDTKLICAGGYNIQTFHTRFLVHVK